MDQLPVSNQFSEWQRFLIGGLLSTAIAGIPLLDLALRGRLGNDKLFPFYAVFIVPGAVIQKLMGGNDFIIFSLNLFFWLLAGAVIAHSNKSNKYATVYWLFLCVGCLFGFGYLSAIYSA
jgi:hypothetical protein